MYMIIYWNQDGTSVYPLLNPKGLHEDGSIMLFETLKEADKFADDYDDVYHDRFRVISIEGVQE